MLIYHTSNLIFPSHLKLQHQHKQLSSIITSKKVLPTINNILNLNHKISRLNNKGKIFQKKNVICCMMTYINDILNKLIFLTSWLINQTSRTIHSLSSTHLFNEPSFRLKFDSFGLWTKFNELITELSLELFLSWIGSLSVLLKTIKIKMCSKSKKNIYIQRSKN